MENSNSLLVAAIDFGTTYSGWAFSFRHEYNQDPTKVSTQTWVGGNVLSTKAPTCVLIHPDGETLAAFGYKAEDKYSELTAEKEHDKWYYFSRFKMMLYDGKGINRGTMLEDKTGKKKLPALLVFSLAIKYLKENLLTTSEGRLVDVLRADDIHWILTVPAIWTDAAKQFMREAAVKAGISDEHLSIALEPEAASIFCRHLPVEQMVGPDRLALAKFKEGTKYMVLDAGGGTVDITVHEVTAAGCLKELHKASGGKWGGTTVDQALEQFFIDLIGLKLWEKFKVDKMEDYLDIFRDFEVKKREIGTDEKLVTMRIAPSLAGLFNEITKQDLCKNIPEKYANKITFTGDKVRVQSEIAKNFFTENAIDKTIDHLMTLKAHKDVRDITAIVMVGGFSEAPLLQAAVRRAFPGVKVLIPKEAGLAVLKGAVIFGHCPSAIVSRVCKYTYGVCVDAHFITGVHPESNRFKEDGQYLCRDAFDVHVKQGQSIKVGEFQRQQIYVPKTANPTGMTFDIYASDEESPVLVTDSGAFKLGSFVVDMSDTTGGLNREMATKMCFSGTEIGIQVENKRTGKIDKAKVHFAGLEK